MIFILEDKKKFVKQINYPVVVPIFRFPVLPFGCFSECPHTKIIEFRFWKREKIGEADIAYYKEI